MKKFKEDTGQALLETLFIIPIIAALMAGIWFFAAIFITQIRLNMACRHGVFLIIHANYNKEQVIEEVKDFLKESKLVESKVKIYPSDVDTSCGKRPAKVKIRYELRPPLLLRAIPGFPNPLILKGHSECYNDTWLLGIPGSNLSHS